MLPENISVLEVLRLGVMARAELRSRYKSVSREYGDRIRKLDKIIEIASAPDSARNNALDGVDGLSLSPDLQKLLLDPTNRL